MSQTKEQKGKNGLRLIKKTKKKTVPKKLWVACLASGCILVVIFLAMQFSIKKIEVKGNYTYTGGEVIQAVKGKDYVGNTLIMVAQNRIFGQTYLPFVEDITMSIKDCHTLKIKIKEKLRSGVFEYMNKNVYFNEDGIAMESRNYRFEDVPVVTGIKFHKLVLGEEIPVEGNYFETILSITKKISTYGLPISEIHFDGENDITLYAGKYEIYLGSTVSLDGKMSKIAEMLDAVSQTYKKGVIDLHLYTDEKNIVTFHK
ncbi:MAG: cell division protein FtsQ/DivIB [Eubacteriales bacterium]|nr:cell division protein FtsQ/DivIB [Eubacteriales bacterium]